MMSIFVVVAVAAFVAAEPPLSKSYLPPSPANRNNGYPQGPQPAGGFTGVPQVIAARSRDQGYGQSGNGVVRSSLHDQSAQARFTHSQGYDENSPFARNAIDAKSEPANYNFGYMVSNFNEGTDFGHHEERLEEKAQGQYHVVLPDGRKQTVSYEADERGFKPQVSYQDTEDLSRSNGYDSNANSRNHGNSFNNGGHVDHESHY